MFRKLNQVRNLTIIWTDREFVSMMTFRFLSCTLIWVGGDKYISLYIIQTIACFSNLNINIKLHLHLSLTVQLVDKIHSFPISRA